MSAEYRLPQQERLDRFVGFSVSIHVLLILFFTVRAFLFPSESLEYQSAVRVDLIGLPDKAQPEPATPAPEPEPAKVEKPAPPTVKDLPKKTKTDPDAINLNKTKSKQKDALAKLKQMDAFEKIQKELEAERAKKAAAKPLKGNVISSGSQLTGLSKIQVDNYIGEVEKQIRQNWALPQWLAKKNYSAQIRVRFDEKGNILSTQIVKSSGNPSFDEIVVDTVRKSAPLPAPPDKFVRLMNLEGILFGFPE